MQCGALPDHDKHVMHVTFSRMSQVGFRGVGISAVLPVCAVSAKLILRPALSVKLPRRETESDDRNALAYESSYRFRFLRTEEGVM